jgi:membrane-associated phospholipid phosphatase
VKHNWVGRVARLLAGFLVIWLVLVGIGLLITKVLRRDLSGETRIERSLAAHRDATLNTVTHYFTLSAETITVIAAVAVLAVLLRLWLGRWRESVFLVVAVAGQSAVFLATTLFIDRPRPSVLHLDAAPPTSSFPSGHTGASIALWTALAVVAYRVGIGWLWRTLAVLAVVIPLSVGASRVYRGMHHPTDVIAGALNGLACVAVARRGVPAVAEDEPVAAGGRRVTV